MNPTAMITCRAICQTIADWHAVMGAWPPVMEKPKIEMLETKARGEGISQQKNPKKMPGINFPGNTA